MKNQFPIRILLMGAISTSSTLSANHPNGDDEYWNVQWNTDSEQHKDAKSKSDSPNFYPLEEPAIIKTPALEKANDDNDWGLEIQKPANAEKLIAQVDAIPFTPPTNTTAAPAAPTEEPVTPEATTPQAPPPKTISINFNNIAIVEYIRFISRISGKNFIFDEKELTFNITIVSEGPTTIQNVMTTLLQELRVHDYSMMEDGNTIIIYKNDEVRNVAKVNLNEIPNEEPRKNEIITQVFRLNTLDPAKAAGLIKPLLSKSALMEVSTDTRQLIITDIIANINQISVLLKGLDSPNSGQVIGQYVARNALVDNLIDLTKQIMAPIANDQPLTFVPHPTAQSIFIIASPFLVERSLSVLQHLDQKKGENKIFTLDDLKYTPINQRPEIPTEEGTPTQAGRWEIDPDGKWVFRPNGSIPGELPQGRWVLDPQGNWYFIPEGATAPFQEGTPKGGQNPRGSWQKDANGKWGFELFSGESIRPEYLRREVEHVEELPVGHIERTKFLLYKLKYRNGKDVVTSIESIGKSLEDSGVINKDLALAISTLQWIEPTNSIIITGTSSSIQKIKELLEEIDTPLKQVFIEMLIIETDIDDSLNFGVNWGAHAAGGETSIAEAFLSGATSLGGTLFNAVGITGAAPDVGASSPATGFNLGVIGQKLTHNGTVFSNLGVLVSFLADQTTTNIIMNPKIITEDNKPCEIFVGINTPFQNESIANDLGSIITTNFQFRDVGSTLNVTPHIGSNNIINLEIKLENSSVTSAPTTAGSNLSTAPAGPTTSINRTTTTVNIPDGYFLILSGMIQDQLVRENVQVPCLGGIPGIGAAFKTKNRTDAKRNLLIFIRPVIIDSDEQMNVITKQQQDIYTQKSRYKEDWKYHMDQALEWLNLRQKCDPCDVCID